MHIKKVGDNERIFSQAQDTVMDKGALKTDGVGERKLSLFKQPLKDLHRQMSQSPLSEAMRRMADTVKEPSEILGAGTLIGLIDAMQVKYTHLSHMG